ncbi:MAG: radical SAM family heme chaperone HemW [Chlorobiaceae bacterium]|jgi:oxygen-independent coproporphyrinogen III oxidase|nr:radical SAM family heme chaperone HemW [Chlorobiaceae bacterium]
MLSLYVHIPFCRSRCNYCDFFLLTRLDHLEPFFTALSQETELRSGELKGKTVNSIHFGGGTPSLVPLHYLVVWLEQVSSLCTFTDDIEIAFEANPEDLENESMHALKAAGITRISLGVQSYVPDKLAALGRQHTSIQAEDITAKALGIFKSVSIDLICGVPGETAALWEADIDTALRLHPQHISVYMLSLEPKTLLQRNVSKGLVAVPDEGVQASMYELALAKLEPRGYCHYEVSNFSLPGHHSRYNLASWKREEYLGFGPSAHSFLCSSGEEIRFANVSSLLRYIAEPGKALGFRETLSDEERFTEKVFLSLRINSGLDVEFLRKENKLGHCLSQKIDRFEQKGWVRLHEGRLYLTGKGFLFADLIAGELIFG